MSLKKKKLCLNLDDVYFVKIKKIVYWNSGGPWISSWITKKKWS